jgi:hypothetical protein
MKKSLFIVLALALLSSGCNTAGLVYRNADVYLQHKINGYTSFNSPQKDTIRREVSNYMRWHQKDALPQYILFLQSLNGTAQYKGQLSTETVAHLRDQLTDLYRMTMTPAIRPTALLLSGLDSTQIKGLKISFAEEIQKQKQQKLDGTQDENLDKRADKTISFIEWLAGNLSKEQEQKVRELSRRLPFASPVYIQNREARQRKLIVLLNSHATADEIDTFLSSWIMDPESSRAPYQQRIYQSFEKGMDDMIIQIHALLTDRQKAHIHKVISSYIEDMRNLSETESAASDTPR